MPAARVPSRLAWTALTAALILALPACGFANSIVLETAAGRSMSGDTLVPAQDGDGVTLTANRPGIRLSRNVRWEQIAAVRINGLQFSRSELQQALKMWSSEGSSANPSGEDTRQVSQVSFAIEPPDPDTPAFTSSLRTSQPVPADDWLPGELVPLEPCCSLPPPNGRIIGVRDDPLSAYPESAAIYPNGIPIAEVPFALDLLRSRKFTEFVPAAIPVAPGEPLLSPNPGLPGAAAGAGNLRRFEARAVAINARGQSDLDSLLVELTGFDDSGREVPLQGTLQATLSGERQQLVHVFDNVLSGQPLDEIVLGAWTRGIDSFGQSAVRFVLPLNQPLPEHDTNIAPFGELRLRFLVPGSGTYETFVPDVQLAQLSGQRDRRLNAYGSRFSESDRTSGSRMSTSFRARNLSSVRPNGRILTVKP